MVVVDEVEREKEQCDELLTLSAGDRTSLDQNVRRLEQENMELQRQLDALQTQLTQAEHSHSDRSDIWWSGVVVSALASVNEVNQRRAQLVLRWATVSGFNSRCWTFHFGM